MLLGRLKVVRCCLVKDARSFLHIGEDSKTSQDRNFERNKYLAYLFIYKMVIWAQYKPLMTEVYSLENYCEWL